MHLSSSSVVLWVKVVDMSIREIGHMSSRVIRGESVVLPSSLEAKMVELR